MSSSIPGRRSTSPETLRDGPPVPAEIVVLLVVLTLTILFSVAGIPGAPEPVATDGSDSLRRGWLEQQAALARDGGVQDTGHAPGQDGDEGGERLDPAPTGSAGADQARLPGAVPTDR